MTRRSVRGGPAAGLAEAAARLAGVVLGVVEDYRAFAAAQAPGAGGDPKAFVAHHAACRAALAHLEHLLRLIRAASGEAEEGAEDAAEAGLRQAERALAEARSGLARLGPEEDEEEVPDGDGPGG